MNAEVACTLLGLALGYAMARFDAYIEWRQRRDVENRPPGGGA